MTALRPQPPLEEEPPDRSLVQQSVAAAVLSAGALWVGLWFGVNGTIGLLFGVGVVALIVPFAVVIGLIVVHVVAAVRLTGQRHIFSSILVVLGSVALTGAWLTQANSIPIWWVAPGVDAAFPLVAITGATLFGLLLGPPISRRVGVSAVIVVGIVIAAPFVVASIQATADAAGRADEAARVEEQRRLQVFEDRIATGPLPMTVDLAGAEIQSMDLWGATTYVVVAGGGMVEVDVEDWNELSNPLTRCTGIAPPGVPAALNNRLEDFADWCYVTEVDAALVGGTGISQIRDDRLVLVHTVKHAATLDPATRPATADEVQTVFNALRPMTEVEIRAAFSPND